MVYGVDHGRCAPGVIGLGQNFFGEKMASEIRKGPTKKANAKLSNPQTSASIGTPTAAQRLAAAKADTGKVASRKGAASSAASIKTTNSQPAVSKLAVSHMPVNRRNVSKSAANKSTASNLLADKPLADKSVADKRAADKRVADKPAVGVATAAKADSKKVELNKSTARKAGGKSVAARAAAGGSMGGAIPSKPDAVDQRLRVRQATEARRVRPMQRRPAQEGSAQEGFALVGSAQGDSAQGNSNAERPAQEKSVQEISNTERPVQVAATEQSVIAPASTHRRSPVDRMSRLVAATAAGNKAAVRRLLKDDASLAREWQPIHAAAANGRAAVVRWLLDAGADANAVSTNQHPARPLHVAVQPAADPSLDEAGATALRAARVETVDALLLGGADVRLRGTEANVTPILLAALSGQEQCLSRMLPYCDAWDIFTAAAVGRVDVIRLMLRREASRARTRDVNGMTALHYCCASGLRSEAGIDQRLLETAEALIAAGCDTIACDDQRQTPLRWAQNQMRGGLVELLIRSTTLKIAA